jgi:hypothetical protein
VKNVIINVFLATKKIRAFHVTLTHSEQALLNVTVFLVILKISFYKNQFVQSVLQNVLLVINSQDVIVVKIAIFDYHHHFVYVQLDILNYQMTLNVINVTESVKHVKILLLV